MLVVISDLHLTDGTTCETINAGAFRQFIFALSAHAESACWRKKPQQSQGVFELLDRIDVILLGDILDVMRSTHWLSSSTRPWDAPDAMFSTVQDITRGILQHNQEAFSLLKNLNGQLPIIASHTGQPHTIPIHFYYMVGNHDWFFHLPGTPWSSLRQELIDAIGLSQSAEEIFPHTLAESVHLQALCQAHHVYLQHGDVFDDVNYRADVGRDAASLGDAIVIEVLNGFPERIRQVLNLAFHDPLYLALKEADNIRPLLSVPDYYLMVIKYFATKSQGQKIKALWSEACTPFLELPFVRSLDRPWHLDPVDKLQIVFSLQKNLSLQFQTMVANLLQRFSVPSSYHDQAMLDIKKYGAQYSVYGHTHHAEMVPLWVEKMPVAKFNGVDTSHHLDNTTWADALRGDDNGHQQTRDVIAFNSGTWRPFHQPTTLRRNVFPYVSFHVMTHLFFYKDDERFGRRYEMWQGSLG